MDYGVKFFMNLINQTDMKDVKRYNSIIIIFIKKATEFGRAMQTFEILL